jgi:hypothetical protein
MVEAASHDEAEAVAKELVGAVERGRANRADDPAGAMTGR